MGLETGASAPIFIELNNQYVENFYVGTQRVP